MSDPKESPAPSRLERIAVAIAAGYAAASWNPDTRLQRNFENIASDSIRLAKELIIQLDAEVNTQ